MRNITMLEAAIDAININNYVPFEDVQNELISQQNPEEIFLEKEKQKTKKMAYNSLTSEARQIIDIILNAPSEIMELIASPKTKKINKERIELMLQEKWGEKRAAKLVMKELEAFVKTF